MAAVHTFLPSFLWKEVESSEPTTTTITTTTAAAAAAGNSAND